VEDEDESAPFPEARGLEQIAAESVLQRGQQYPGDAYIQEERRFLVYQMSDTEHIIMDNMINEGVPFPTRYLRDPEFDIAASYAEEEDNEPTDTSSDDSGSESDSNDGSASAVSAFVAETAPVRKYVVNSGATEHCFRDREDFAEYHPASRARAMLLKDLNSGS
jgi:hypothetical protein